MSFGIPVRNGLSVGLRASTTISSRSGTSVLGASASSVTTLPNMVQFHPNTNTVTLSGSRIATATDLKGNYNLTAATVSGANYTGPQQLTDLLGRKFWRFAIDSTGRGQVLQLPDTFVATKRGVTVFMVGRIHRATTNNAIFSIGGGITIAGLEVASPSVATAAIPRSGNRAMAKTDTNFANLVSGSQLHLVGTASRDTVSNGIKYYLNNFTSDALGQAGTDGTGGGAGTPAEIGRCGSNWGMFDLYEFVAVPGTVTDAQANTIRTEMMANWQFSAITNQLLILGDSISAGVQASDDSGQNSSMWISEPGAGFLPSGWRCVNNAVSGYETLDVIADRDAAQSWSNATISSGRNVAAIEIGTNDLSATNNFSGAQVTTVSGSNTITLTTAPTSTIDANHGMLDGTLVYGANIPVGSQITLASGTRNVVGSTYTMVAVDTATPSNATAPGTNVVLTGGRSATDTYNQAARSIVAIVNTTTTGLLQRGWEVRSLVNISSTSANKQIELAKLRTKLEAPAFLTDCLAGTGQAYDGKLTRILTYTIQDGGVSRFDSTTAAGNLTYYLSDGIHPTLYGAKIRVRGGDNLTLAVTYGL